MKLWGDSDSEDEFAESFFASDSSEEIIFPDKVAQHLISWDMLEDFSDWCRSRTFEKSEPWEHFCSAWKMLGLMEVEEYTFGPVNELVPGGDAEIVFGALSPDSVAGVLGHLEKIDGGELDAFIESHTLKPRVQFSEQVAAVREALVPGKGLVIFAG